MDCESFQAVLDESGYEADDPKYPDDLFVFAGYFGKVADWEKFTHDWDAILTTNPELKDADVVKKLFRHRKSKSDARALKLLSAVTDNRDLGAVRWQLPYLEYRKVVVTHILGGDENLYVFAWFGVLLRLIAEIRDLPNATLDLIYDENIYEEKKLQVAYGTFYKWLTTNHPDTARILPREPTPRSDKDFWPLRAADAIAWNTHRHYICKQASKPFSNPLSRLLDSGPSAFVETWDAEAVRQVLLNRHSRT
jgi:hypothetical protein